MQSTSIQKSTIKHIIAERAKMKFVYLCGKRFG